MTEMSERSSNISFLYQEIQSHEGLGQKMTLWGHWHSESRWVAVGFQDSSLFLLIKSNQHSLIQQQVYTNPVTVLQCDFTQSQVNRFLNEKRRCCQDLEEELKPLEMGKK
jgi:hypothetical protein